MKIINKINPRISAFKFIDEVRGFLINSLLKNEKILAFYPNCSLDEKGHSAVVIIPGISEPPVQTLRATIPENKRHIFR